MTTELEPISLSESKRLVELEKVIKQHGAVFIAVGDALTEIRDSRLYRSDYATFEIYCKEVWGWSGSRSRQLCAAAAFAKAESVTTGNAFASEREARAAMKEKRDAAKPSKAPLAEASEPTSRPEPEQPAALKGIDVAKLDDAPEFELTETAKSFIESAEVSADNLKFIIGELKAGTPIDCSQLKEIRAEANRTVRWLVSLEAEICG